MTDVVSKVLEVSVDRELFHLTNFVFFKIKSTRYFTGEKEGVMKLSIQITKYEVVIF